MEKSDASETSSRQEQWQYAQGTTKKYDIPLAHMDYGYIGECKDVKELEKILKVLRSGDEGCFPEMEKFVEEKISKLEPNSRTLRKENQILTFSGLDRNERQALSEDLMNWTSSMKSSDLGQSNKENEFEDDSLPPVRSGKILVNGHNNQRAEEPRKNKSAKPRSYAEWDKFDIEKELEKADKAPEDKTIKKSAHQPVVEEVVDTSGMSDEEKARKATREKDKGNEAFRSGDYKEAIAYYTRSIQLQSNAASFNNRALAYLKEKEWMRAETDCNKVLTLEPDNIKALLRRGSAYKGKKEFSKALVDFQRVLELEPANKRAEELIEELKKDEKKYEREKQERKEKGKRMVIEETDGSDESGDEIIVETRDKSDAVKVNENAVKEKPLVNGFHEPTNQEQPLAKSKKVDSQSTNENEEKKPSNQNKASKDIWDDEEVPVHNSREEFQASSSSRNISNEGQNIRKQQENVAVCENSNNINIENEMMGGNSTSETSDRLNVVEDKCSEEKSNSTNNEQSLECEQNRQNESKEAEAVEGAKSSNDNVDQSGEPVSEQVEPVLARPVYIQGALPEGAAKLREEGNNLFKAGQYGDAIEKYTKAIEQLSKAKDDQRVNLSLIYSNRAACHLKTGAPSEVIKDCTTSLDMVPHSIKPLLRRGNAYEMLERFDKAYIDYKHVLSIDSTVDMASQGSSRSQSHLQQTHGIKWREKLPKVPSVMWWEIPEIRDSSSPQVQSPTVNTISSSSSSSSTKSSTTSSSVSSSESSSSTSQVADSQAKPALSTEEQYEIYKTEGNNLVKKGEYRQAITSYSQCVELIPDRAVGYCNRSLCYLRTNQPEKAEADCSQALKTESENVKALFRRAQAKKMLKRYKESLEDLTSVLKLEPSNSAAKKEMDVVKNYYREELISLKAKMTKSKDADPKETPDKPSSSKPRKRMVIQEVDSEEEEEAAPKSSQKNKLAQLTKTKQASSQEANNSKGKSKVEEVTVQSSKQKMKVEEVTTKQSSEKVKVEEAKTKQSSQKAKVEEMRSSSAKKKGGNKSGRNRKDSDKQQTSSSSSTSSTSSSQKKSPSKSSTIKTTSAGLPKATPSVPKLQEKATPYEFMQAWNSLKSAPDSKPYSDLLKQIPPERLPEVISNKLDGQMLNTITACVSKHYITNGEYSLSYNILSNLCKVDRFGTIAMFLSGDEQKEIKSVIDELSKHSQEFSADDLSRLKSKYNLK